MSSTTATIVPTPDAREPFKVVFASGGREIAEQAVSSRLSGDELIARLLPTLQGFAVEGVKTVPRS